MDPGIDPVCITQCRLQAMPLFFQNDKLVALFNARQSDRNP